jgi:hydroxypyruvate isomerase
MGKPADQQEKIAATLRELKMDLGPFVGYANFGEESFVLPPKEIKDRMLEQTKKWIETHKRTGVQCVLVVPGRYNQRLEWDYQTTNVIENLKYCAKACLKAGLVIVLEPLNPHDHPGLFLTKMPQAYQICQAVNNPSCKIVDDLYHQQITEGNLIPNIDRCWNQIDAFHLGDNPGRKEPGTGEINYKNIFKHLYKKGYDGVLCCEHGLSQKGKEGELAFEPADIYFRRDGQCRDRYGNNSRRDRKAAPKSERQYQTICIPMVLRQNPTRRVCSLLFGDWHQIGRTARSEGLAHIEKARPDLCHDAQPLHRQRAQPHRKP